MRRSASESSCWVVPDWGMQVPPAQASEYAAVASVVGPVKVELAVVTKSTWNFQYASVFAVEPRPTMNAGEPEGGRRDPSRSDGNRPPKAVLVLKQTCAAAAPASILARSYAQTL